MLNASHPLVLAGVCVVLAGLTACLDVPAAPCDHDRDGWQSHSCAGDLPVDCADDDPLVHPGALELCGDNIDQDCAGADLPCSDALAPMTVTADEQGLVIGDDRYELRLGSAHGDVISELRALDASGLQLLLPANSQSFGFAALAHWVEWSSYDPVATPEVTLLSEGPAVVRVAVGWRSGGTEQSPAVVGTTTHTLLPGGRMHRDERVSVDQLPADMSNNAYLDAYVAIDARRATRVEWAAQLDGPVQSYTVEELFNALDFFYLGTPDDRGWMCAHHTSNLDRVGLAYRSPDPTNVAGPRAGALNDWPDATPVPDNHHLSLSFDWVRNGDARGDHRAHLLTMAGRASANDPCAAVEAEAAAFLRPLQLEVDPPASIITDLPDDLDADGFVEAHGYHAIDAGGARGTVSIHGAGSAAAPTTLLWIRNLDAAMLPVLELDGETLVHGRDYLLQVEADAAWVYLERELSAAGFELLLIRPAPA